MRLTFEVDTKVYGKDHILLIKRADKARLELVKKVTAISPVLARNLTEFKVRCAHPGYSRPQVEYWVPLHTAFAQGGAVFRHVQGDSGFTLLQPQQIVEAFMSRNDDVAGEVPFLQSRLGKAFLWNINAGRKQLEERGATLTELTSLDVFDNVLTGA
ncbi:MAG TPA: hypothetical protein VKP88_02965 [Candidatus Paceibacterota bacterium]|nr:hypothetical protein [Candidatus Paceibacterota bacterium]